MATFELIDVDFKILVDRVDKYIDVLNDKKINPEPKEWFYEIGLMIDGRFNRLVVSEPIQVSRQEAVAGATRKLMGIMRDLTAPGAFDTV